MYHFYALTLVSGYVADAGSLSKLLFAQYSVSAPEYVSMLWPLPLSFSSLHLLLLLPCFPFPSFLFPVFFCWSSPSSPSAVDFPFCFSASPFLPLRLLLLLARQDPEHPGRALMTHAHAVVREASQDTEGWTASRAH